MKQGIHPDYVQATVRCSCGAEFVTRATQPEIRVELCNQCHPFYTGKQKLVDSGGRVERYKQRYAKTTALKERSGGAGEQQKAPAAKKTAKKAAKKTAKKA
jgi:large subunit ribosomal protein L31